MLTVSLDAPEKLRLVEKDEASPGPDEVRVRVRAAGIGGTDLRIYKGILGAKLPLVLGQEFAGVVDRVGDSVKGFAVGDRVAVEPVVRDNTCEYCKDGRYTLCDELKVIGIQVDGGYSESVVVPSYTLYRLPDRLSFEEGALLVPAAVASYALSRTGGVAGSTLAVVGAGPIGFCLVQLAVLEGASKILVVEPVESRRALAVKMGNSRTMGASPAYLSDALKEMTGGKGFDVIIEATGNQESVDPVLASVRKSGTVVFAGAFGKPAQVTMTNIVRKDITVRGSWLYPNFYGGALRLAEEGKLRLKEMVSDRFRLVDAAAAFEDARSPDALKVILTN
jgi:2-desacetyl-2-hydroxyethyl bacteriochlorophyllide A dehydrogenase